MTQYAQGRHNYKTSKGIFIRPFEYTVSALPKRVRNKQLDSSSTKISQLLLRLKSGTQSTVSFSQMTNSLCQLRQSKLKASSIWELKQHIDTIFISNNQAIEQLTEYSTLLLEKQQQQANWNQYYTVISISLQQLNKFIEDAKSRFKYSHSIFRPIFQRHNLKASSIAQQKSRKQTLNSIIRDSSLLLSFKKNLEEDDGHITLKYSEESAHKDIDLMSHNRFQSFAKCDPVNKRLSYKEDVFETEQDESFQKDAIKGFGQMEQLKGTVSGNQQSIRDAINIYEDLINKFIQAIVQEKVQSQHEAQAIITQTNSELKSLHSIITLSHNNHQSEQLFSELAQQIFQKLQIQRQQRLFEFKGMIGMMMKVVQYLQ